MMKYKKLIAMNTQARINFFGSRRSSFLIPIWSKEDNNSSTYRLRPREDHERPVFSPEETSPAGRREVMLSGQTRYSGFVARLTELIEANIDDEAYDIDQLCRDAGASRSTIHKQLKRWTGLSTSFFIRGIRLQRAKEILLTSDLNITQVAYEVGFKDAHYFTRVFSESFGISPKAFRKHECLLEVV